jgi:hypothetical protein
MFYILHYNSTPNLKAKEHTHTLSLSLSLSLSQVDMGIWFVINEALHIDFGINLKNMRSLFHKAMFQMDYQLYLLYSKF